MIDTAAPVRAVIDVGSNTVRLLVARIQNGHLEQVEDRSEFVRLGKGVDSSGNLAPDRIEAACAAVQALLSDARAAGASSIRLVATSAVRDAANGGEFANMIRGVAGIPLEIISGDEEARLTYRGATLNLHAAGAVVVCDLGGGSAEIIATMDGSVNWSVSLQLGSGRLTERFIHHDPPSPNDIAEVQEAVRRSLGDNPDFDARLVVFTGGTATTCASLLGAHGPDVRLVPADLDRALDMTLSATAETLAAEHGIRLERAQVLPAGIAALSTIVAYYSAERVVVTTHGIREGVLLDEA